MHASRLNALIPGCRTRTVGSQLMVSLGQQDLLSGMRAPTMLLDARARSTLVEVAKKYGALSASKLKTAVYLTAPMRELLRKEKSLRLSLFNSAVLGRR
jgi:uncharacterized phage-associated protein